VRDTDAVLDLGSGSGKVCYIAAQVVGLFGSRAALNYMIVSDAGKPFEMDDRPTESGALVLKASLGRSRPSARTGRAPSAVAGSNPTARTWSGPTTIA
jgi:hypothetical protein